jgi:hypothetical protein
MQTEHWCIFGAVRSADSLLGIVSATREQNTSTNRPVTDPTVEMLTVMAGERVEVPEVPW